MKEKLKNEKFMKRLVWIASILIPIVVTVIHSTPKPDLAESTKKALYWLPTLNATVNGTIFFLLIIGVFAIKKGNKGLHFILMTASLILSLVFLLSYVVFHATMEQPVYGGEGTIRTVYLTILLTHVLLSAIIVPLVLFTYVRGLTNVLDKHRKLAKITFPLWLYVCATGVIVYYMIKPFYLY